MSESFIKNLFRFLPVPLWLVAAGVAVNQFIQLQGAATVSVTDRSALEKVFPYAFLVGALICVRLAYREYGKAMAEKKREQQADEDRARLLPRKDSARTHELSDDLKMKLIDSLQALQSCGVLQADELNADTLMEDAMEIDAFETMDLDDVLRILHGLSDRFHHPLANMAFFPDSVEMRETDIFLYVEEFARLTHQEDSLRRLRLQGFDGGPVQLAKRGEFPGNNACIEFELRGIEHRCAFTMYSKNAPLGLLAPLAEIFEGGDKRFVMAFGDCYCVTQVTSVAFDRLNKKFPNEFSLAKNESAIHPQGN